MDISISYIYFLFIFAIISSANTKYILANAGMKCPPGSTSLKNAECAQACKDLGISKIDTTLANGKMCFKNSKGICRQNGKNGLQAQLVCKTDKKDGKINLEAHFFILDKWNNSFKSFNKWIYREEFLQCVTARNLKNAGKDCWINCKSRQGKCSWCGDTGMCCKKGFHDKSNGCDGTFGGKTRHECVLRPGKVLS